MRRRRRAAATQQRPAQAQHGAGLPDALCRCAHRLLEGVLRMSQRRRRESRHEAVCEGVYTVFYTVLYTVLRLPHQLQLRRCRARCGIRSLRGMVVDTSVCASTDTVRSCHVLFLPPSSTNISNWQPTINSYGSSFPACSLGVSANI